jgi:signal recognition particle GTPase
MGDFATFMDQVKTMNLGKNKEMAKHLEQGIFTIRDMRDQLGNLMKMGPLSKLAGNIPGMSALAQQEGSDEEGNLRMRRMMYMMDSMTEKGIILASTISLRSIRARFGWEVFCLGTNSTDTGCSGLRNISS